MIELLKKQRKHILIFFSILIVVFIITPALLLLTDINLPEIFSDNSRFIYICLVMALVLSVIMIFFLLVISKVERKTRINYINIASTLGADIQETYAFAQLGLVSFDEDNKIIWTNELFEQRDIDIIGEDWTKLYPLLTDLLIDNKKDITVEINSRKYSVRLLSEMKLFIFKDVSDYVKLEKSFREGAPLIIQILIDNYQDLAMRDSDDELEDVIGKVKDCVFTYAEENGILLSRRRTESFFGFFNEVNYQKILSERFSLLEQVRQLGTKEYPLTLSIGIGRGTTNMLKLGELSTNALDVALSRGGDQLVVSTYGQSLEFFGGKSEGRGQSSKVRTRVLAQGFVTTLESAARVTIMMHANADLDAVGAAFGVYAICKAINIPARIVYEERSVEAKTKLAVKSSLGKSLNDYIVSAAHAAEGVKDDDLLVLVDVHKPSITMNPKLLTIYEKIAIIDHHRRQEEFVSDNVFALIEPSSSSTSEIIAQFFKTANQEIDVSPEIATLMLSGIIVDTNNFHRGADARTYESAMILKEYGAEIEKANEFLADEFEEFVLKNKMLANSSTPFFGVLIACGSEEDIVTRTTIAKVADTGVDVRGINAIFVIGRTKVDEISLSCRSTPQFNVQIVAEKLGGGGHFTGAAAQFKDDTIENVKKKVIEQLESYFEEERKMNK